MSQKTLIVIALLLGINFLSGSVFATDRYLEVTTGKASHPYNPPKPVYCGDSQCSLDATLIEGDQIVMEISPINMDKKLSAPIQTACEKIVGYKNITSFKCVTDHGLTLVDDIKSIKKIESVIDFYPELGRIVWDQIYYFKAGTVARFISQFSLAR